MKGLELSEKFYNEFGKQMLEEQFPNIIDKIAIGLCGSGSECYGYDDESSTDHDFEPAFCIFLPDEDIVDSRLEFQLERAYAKLPKEFMGYKRSLVSPVGGSRHGVIRLSEFLIEKIGVPDGNLSEKEWLTIPSFYIGEVLNGKIFRDDSKLFTSVREALSNMPEDILLKKIAGYLLTMAQSGQYNFTRCLEHGEYNASQLAILEFVKATLNVLFLLNNKPMPFYKWSFRALRDLSFGKNLEEKLSILLTGDNKIEDTINDKLVAISEITDTITEELKNRGLTDAICNDLEKHAYSVNDRIKDSYIRNLNILAGVN